MDDDTGIDKIAIEALDATLDIFSPNGKRLILELLHKEIGLPLTLHEEVRNPKHQIELALTAILGQDGSRLLIQEWNNKIMKARIN